jgi:ribosomal protein S18 acetylase RimI-like enzyme
MCKFLAGMGEIEPLIRSAARNHTSWMTARAQAAGGGVRAHGALRWVVGGTDDEASLPFPTRVAGEDADAMLADCRVRDQHGIGCWTTGLEPVGEVAAVLVARGFEWGWSAHWMAFDIDALPAVEDDRVTVSPGPWRDTWRAVAPAAGQALVHLADGEAGLYDVGVEPAHRRTGLGRALTVAALATARDAGARVATVNATEEGERLYRSVGARSLGHGQTFWIHRAGLYNPPSETLVAVAEAAGRGSVPVDVEPQALAARLPGNGMGLAHVALAAGHRDAAARLAAGGAARDPRLAYDLGGADGLVAYAAERPGAIDERYRGRTILHDAVQARDAALLRTALALGADVGARDRRFESTPLEWAQQLGNDEAAALLTR